MVLHNIYIIIMFHLGSVCFIISVRSEIQLVITKCLEEIHKFEVVWVKENFTFSFNYNSIILEFQVQWSLFRLEMSPTILQLSRILECQFVNITSINKWIYKCCARMLLDRTSDRSSEPRVIWQIWGMLGTVYIHPQSSQGLSWLITQSECVWSSYGKGK